MGKTKTRANKGCLRCENFAEEDSELCWQCEQDALNELYVLPDYEDPLDQDRANSMEGGE